MGAYLLDRFFWAHDVENEEVRVEGAAAVPRYRQPPH
jgi:hypothetical protein